MNYQIAVLGSHKEDLSTSVYEVAYELGKDVDVFILGDPSTIDFDTS